MAGSAPRKKLRWTDDQEFTLRKLWGTQRDAEIAALLGKTVKSVRSKATEMNVRAEKGLRTVCRSGRVTYPWRDDEDLVLVKNVGHLSIFELMNLLPRRNRLAIERRCYELGFSPTQGTHTRLQIERDTGYDWRQIQRARDALGQTWKRYGTRKYMITFDQVQDIIEYLRTETRKWSLHYDLDACLGCGTSGTDERSRHSGDGLCKKCVSGDARIMVKGLGMVKISDMVGHGEFEVWSGMEWRKTEAMSAGIKHTVTVMMSNGWSVRTTPDHKFKTIEGMIRADELLGKKVRLELPAGSPFPEVANVPRRDKYDGRLGDRFPSVWSRDLGALLGFILGDGCISKSKYPTVIIGVGRQDKKCLVSLKNLISTWCSTKTKIYDFQPKPNNICMNPGPVSRVQWRCTGLVQFLSDVGLDKKKLICERRVPWSLWTSSRDGVAGFLSGIFGSDGSVSQNKSGKIEVSMATVSRGLADDVQMLLASFGIRSAVWLYPPVDGCYQRYAVSVFGFSNVERFSNQIGFFCKRKQEKLVNALYSHRKKPRTGQAVTVVSVVCNQNEQVYDLLNVGSERQFLANGISVSNCWDFRRHGRVRVLGAIRKGRVAVLTEDVWSLCVRDEPPSRDDRSVFAV